MLFPSRTYPPGHFLSDMSPPDSSPQTFPLREFPHGQFLHKYNTPNNVTLYCTSKIVFDFTGYILNRSPVKY